MHVMSHVAALHCTPAAHAAPLMQLTVHAAPPHTTPPF
jgi:hypothetical protein